MSEPFFSTDVVTFPSDTGSSKILMNRDPMRPAIAHVPKTDELYNALEEFDRRRFRAFWRHRITRKHPNKDVILGLDFRIGRYNSLKLEYFRLEWLNQILGGPVAETRTGYIPMERQVQRKLEGMTPEEQAVSLEKHCPIRASDVLAGSMATNALRLSLFPIDLKAMFVECGRDFHALIERLERIATDRNPKSHVARAMAVEATLFFYGLSWVLSSWTRLTHTTKPSGEYFSTDFIGHSYVLEERIRTLGIDLLNYEKGMTVRGKSELKIRGAGTMSCWTGVRRCLTRMLFLTTTFREPTDLSVAFISEFTRIHTNANTPRSIRRWLMNQWMLVHPTLSFPVEPPPSRLREYFQRTIQHDPRFDEWIDISEKYLNNKDWKMIEGPKCNIGALLRFLRSLPNPPRNPKEVSRREHMRDVTGTNQNTFWEHLRRNEKCKSNRSRNIILSRVKALFEWYAVEYQQSIPPLLTDTDYFNIRGERRAKSFRESMPMSAFRALQAMIIVTDENGQPKWTDWVKTRPSDTLVLASRRTGQQEKTWCPILAGIQYFKLTYPSRTTQVRWLDSGERDEEIFDFRTQGHTPNPYPELRIHRRALGLLQPDSQNRRELMLVFNTNKTQIFGAQEAAFRVPWTPKEIVFVVSEVLRWQAEFGAWPNQLISRSHDPAEPRKRGEEAEKAEVTICPLFRDPRRPTGMFPPDDPMVVDFYVWLCSRYDELHCGDANRDGVRLTRMAAECPRKKPNGKLKCRPVYDLHSLRITGITAFAELGVPLDVLMDLAGHFVPVMTLYYTKRSHESQRQIIKAAAGSVILVVALIGFGGCSW